VTVIQRSKVKYVAAINWLAWKVSSWMEMTETMEESLTSRLPRARGADHYQRLPLPDLDGDIAQGLYFFGIGLADPFKFYDVVAEGLVLHEDPRAMLSPQRGGGFP